MEVLSSSKNVQSLKEIQKVLDLPELKIVRPSDTCWLAHERCVKALKASYSSIVFALENIYQTSIEPEAFVPSRALSSHYTIAALYLLTTFFLKWQSLAVPYRPSKHFDLSPISSLVDATLNSLDDAILPSENWVLQRQDAREELKEATGIEVTHLDMLFSRKSGQAFYRTHQR